MGIYLDGTGPAFDDYRRLYYDTDRWSLPPEVLEPTFVPPLFGYPTFQGQGPNTDQSANNTPAVVPYQGLKPSHPFSSQFTNDYDEVDLG